MAKWRKGQTGNAGGKPKNARNRVTVKFLEVLAEDFEKHGVSAIVAARKEDPVGYIRVVAGLLPKEFVIERPLEQLSDDELATLIDTLRQAIGPALGAGNGSGAEGEPQQAQKLPTIQ